MKKYNLDKLLNDAALQCTNYPDGAIYHEVHILPKHTTLDTECKKYYPKTKSNKFSSVTETELKEIVKTFFDPPLGKKATKVFTEFFNIINIELFPYQSYILEWDLQPYNHSIIIGIESDKANLLIDMSWSRD